MSHSKVASLSLANMWVGFSAFAVAVLLGVYQVIERMELIPALKSSALYFGSVSTHGVLIFQEPAVAGRLEALLLDD